MHSPGSRAWHLTVVRTQGPQLRPPEKSWRLVVTVLVDEVHVFEAPLGSDGQNPNLKRPFILHDLEGPARLDINVWHVSQKKPRKCRNHVASASVSLDEVLQRQSRVGSDVDIELACQTLHIRKSKQQRRASLTIRLIPPFARSISSSSSHTAVASPSSPSHEDEDLSEPPSPTSSHAFTLEPEDEDDSDMWPESPKEEVLPEATGLRRRRRRRKGQIRGYMIQSDVDDTGDSMCEEESLPPTPHNDDLPLVMEDIHLQGLRGSVLVHEAVSAESVTPCSPSILPQHVADTDSVENSLSFFERCLDRLSPYSEMKDASSEDDYEKILGRLLTEWYVVGASLLTLAGIDAAVFGFSSGTLFVIDGRARTMVSFGAITAGLGIVFDAWFLLLYSGASPSRFQRLSLDVYGTHIFFCLTCRIPAVCMLLSAVSMMLFLISVAWSAMSTAALVICCLAGVLLTLQYLVYGCHRLINAVIWLVRCTWRSISVRFTHSTDVDHPSNHPPT